MGTLVPQQTNALDSIMESVIANGDLAKLTPSQRLTWYKSRCDAIGLDYVTQPFMYVTLQGKLSLYATRTATQQLAQKRRISLQTLRTEYINGLFVVTVRATEPDGRFTEELGAVPIEKLSGDALANAMMKAHTKAQRRAVLSLTGLGMIDETEVPTVQGARLVNVDLTTGEIIEGNTQDTPAIAPPPKEDISARNAKALELGDAWKEAGLPSGAERAALWTKILGHEAKAVKDLTLGEMEKLRAYAFKELQRLKALEEEQEQEQEADPFAE